MTMTTRSSTSVKPCSAFRLSRRFWIIWVSFQVRVLGACPAGVPRGKRPTPLLTTISTLASSSLLMIGGQPGSDLGPWLRTAAETGVDGIPHCGSLRRRPRPGRRPRSPCWWPGPGAGRRGDADVVLRRELADVLAVDELLLSGVVASVGVGVMGLFGRLENGDIGVLRLLVTLVRDPADGKDDDRGQDAEDDNDDKELDEREALLGVLTTISTSASSSLLTMLRRVNVAHAGRRAAPFRAALLRFETAGRGSSRRYFAEPEAQATPWPTTT